MIALMLAAAYGSIYSNDAPPKRYQGAAFVRIHFASKKKVAHTCAIGMRKPPPGTHYSGCNRSDRTIWVENPCLYLDEPYALTLCHELGHWHGWPESHPR